MRPHARLGARPSGARCAPPAPGVECLWPRRRRARARPAGLQLHLASLRRKAPAQLAHGPEIEGNVILHPSAKIGRDCKIGPNVSIGIECVIEDGARISNSVLLHRVKARLRSVMLAPAPLAQGVRAHTPARLHPGRCMLREAVAAVTSIRGTRGGGQRARGRAHIGQWEGDSSSAHSLPELIDGKRGAQVKNFARVADSIIGWGSSIGRWARIDNKSVIGEDVHIKARAPRCARPPSSDQLQSTRCVARLCAAVVPLPSPGC